jgi:tetratricopeptide (TPR) repeat protein
MRASTDGACLSVTSRLLFRGGCCLLLAVLLAACRPSLVRDDVHERGWLLVETQHVALRTDLDEEDALARARQLEQSWHALARMYALVAPGGGTPVGRFPVIHFASCLEFQRIGGARAGFVFGAGYWLDVPTAVTCERAGDTTLMHELAHLFNQHHFAGLPAWVEEGLATYYSTLIVRDGEIVTGTFPAGFAGLARRPAWLADVDGIRRMSYEDFHQERKVSGNYFSAWKLVHVLNSTGPDRLQRFRRFLGALRFATDSEDAWAQAFGDLPAAPLAEDFKWYQKRLRLNGWAARFHWSEPAAPSVRQLRPGEAHILWAVLLVNAGHREAARAQLDRLAAADPDWPELLYWRAVLLQPPNALDLLRQYVHRQPKDARGWRALVSEQLDRAVPASYLGLDSPPPPALAAMEGDVRRLVEHASDASSLNTIGWYFALRQNATTGLNFAIRSLQAQPRCGPCWDTAALLYFQAGKRSKALEAQERAVRLYAERAPPDVLARLRRFRVAAGAARK